LFKTESLIISRECACCQS